MDILWVGTDYTWNTSNPKKSVSKLCQILESSFDNALYYEVALNIYFSTHHSFHSQVKGHKEITIAI